MHPRNVRGDFGDLPGTGCLGYSPPIDHGPSRHGGRRLWAPIAWLALEAGAIRRQQRRTAVPGAAGIAHDDWMGLGELVGSPVEGRVIVSKDPPHVLLSGWRV